MRRRFPQGGHSTLAAEHPAYREMLRGGPVDADTAVPVNAARPAIAAS